jgi:NADH-quinone oxidoreductase subunit A
VIWRSESRYLDYYDLEAGPRHLGCHDFWTASFSQKSVVGCACFEIAAPLEFCAMAAADYSPALFITVFLAVAIAFPFVPLGLAALWARYFSPAKPGPIKNATYECGLKSEGDAWIQFKSDYYLYAILFLIFDVEAIFMFPFGVAFLSLPAGAVGAMLIFVLLLVEGLAWAWAKGVLSWK